MPIRSTVLAALVVLAFAGGALAEVIRGAVDLIITGRVVSTGSTSLVLSSDEQGPPIPFLVSTTTVLPPGLVVGDRVTVHYHPIGTTGQIADRVDRLDEPVPTRPVGNGTSDVQSPAAAQPPMSPQATPAAPVGSRRQASPQLPSTASPLPFVGLVALAAFVGSLCVRFLERLGS